MRNRMDGSLVNKKQVAIAPELSEQFLCAIEFQRFMTRLDPERASSIIHGIDNGTHFHGGLMHFSCFPE